jgi:phosphoglycerate dehydrogenase-like enzyme
MAMIAVLTDADRFPFDRSDVSLLAGGGVELRTLTGHDPDAIAEAAADAVALFVYHARVDRSLLRRLPALRIVARCGTGIELIDLDAAREQGVRVTNVQGAMTGEVADHTIGLILACARRIVLSDRKLREGHWMSSADFGSLRRLRGQTLGLVGFGEIARAVAGRAEALRMRVAANDPFLPHECFSQHNVQNVSFDELIARSDVISLHAPLTDETRGLIGASELARMQPGAILVNTGRGELVDEQALVAALLSGQLQAAGLDVYAEEPPTPESQLRTLDQVVLEPHSAAFSEEALAELRERAIADTLRVLAGIEPLGAVA